MTDESPEPAPVPRWASKPFYRFLDHLEELMTLLDVSMQGIATLRGMPRLIELLAGMEEPDEASGDDAQSLEGRLKRARRAAAFAKREVQRGFPLLHAQATISLWGSLEDLVQNFVTLLLRHDPTAMEVRPVQRLRVRVGELLSLDQEGRAQFLMELLDRETSGPLRQGVNRFENLLAPFDLSGDVGERISQDLFELYHVRNLHAHRQGYADRRFCEACPWLNAEEGKYWNVTHQRTHQYSRAVSEYVILLMYRIGIRYGWTKEDIDRHSVEHLSRVKDDRESRWEKLSGGGDDPTEDTDGA